MAMEKSKYGFEGHFGSLRVRDWLHIQDRRRNGRREQIQNIGLHSCG
jgi:hypothetical protein